MMHLDETQELKVREHMMHEEGALLIKYKSRSMKFIVETVSKNEKEDYEKMGYSEIRSLKRKVKMSKPKEESIQFEDDIWCMFYNLGFRILNKDEHLRVQWGPNPEDTQQLDVVAVGDDAIFVVECKAASNWTKGNFKDQINKIEQYKEGVSNILRQLYGPRKKVKFIFATRQYRIGDEDKKRMNNAGIFGLNDNAYAYISNLIKSYKESARYQFYALMFKDELINEETYKFPVLRGEMGGNKYYICSIEPSVLLKIGFVLHRTRVNDSMSPTYQRLLVPKRIPGITKFIDAGGYFPNSIIINFNSENEYSKIKFRPIKADTDSKSEFGYLLIPNAYGIAFIIDGQHRLYGYAQSRHKDDSTIPVVAFENMPSEEQLKIFMDINENQKAVSPSLRLDLVEDLCWNASNLDSRMKALRSSIIKNLSNDQNKILYRKITIGEDIAELTLKPFDTALSKSGLIPKASKTQWVGDTDICIFNTNETDVEKAMYAAKEQISNFINYAYEIADEKMTEECKKVFLFSNRATYPFICLLGSLHAHLIKTGELNPSSTIFERNVKMKPYVEFLSVALNNLPEEEKAKLTGHLGQGAETHWFRAYQNIINKHEPEYAPEELIEWQETQDQTLQEEGGKYKGEIKQMLRSLVFNCLEKTFGRQWQNNVAILKNAVEGRIIRDFADNDGFEMSEYDWKDYVEISEYKEIISQNFTYPNFSDVFAIDLNNGFKSKKEKLAWMSLLVEPKNKNGSSLTRSQINQLEIISTHLSKFVLEDNV